MSTYTRNEPGVLFVDTINRLNPVSYCQYISCTNPCAQIPQPSNVCNLSNMNLTKFINKQTGQFQFELFKKYVSYNVRFLDNILQISSIPIPQYQRAIKQKRRIGVGVLGIGSALYMLKLKFGSAEAIQFTNMLYKIKSETEHLISALIGKEKGSFISFDKDKYFNTQYWRTLDISQDIKNNIQYNIKCMRNSVHSTSAPTGNTSIFAGIVSGGIQPVFAKEYVR